MSFPCRSRPSCSLVGSENPFLTVCSNRLLPGMKPAVKNGFSDPTKVQKGWDRQRKDIEDDRQGKALKEGCHERRWAWMGVSSREEINTNRNLARVTTKSKSGTQTVSNGRVGRRVKN